MTDIGQTETVVLKEFSMKLPVKMIQQVIKQTKLNVPKRLRKTNLQAFLASNNNLNYLIETKTDTTENERIDDKSNTLRLLYSYFLLFHSTFDKLQVLKY